MNLTKLLSNGIALITLFGVPLSFAVSSADAAEAGRPKSDSRATQVHRIPLKDENGTTIRPKTGSPKAPAYSPAQTCGSCHEYEQVSHGWHFNAAEGKNPGRPGEPWILTDPTTRTQLPLSYRGWAGTYKPGDVGLSDWQFTTNFAHHLPGGGVAEPDKKTYQDPKQRWHVSGKMEIDCLICHSADLGHDPNERAKQLSYENFRWAPTLGLGLGAIKGNPDDRFAKRLPLEWDLKKASAPDADSPGPQIMYDMPRFDPDGLVTINITKRPPASRCYYCHTTRPAVDRTTFWHTDMDVHIRAGFTCSDCHRNGMDHAVTRGYETEGEERHDEMATSLSCRGCHMGVESAKSATVALGGRMGAPRPLHVGLPPVHLEKLACTACHSGSWPTTSPEAIQTSLAHALGYESATRTPKSGPGIVAPVFLRGKDNKIAPHKMVWPNFWGRMDKQGKVTPLAPSAIQEELAAATKAAAAPTTRPTTGPAVVAAKPPKMPLPTVKEGAAEASAPLSDQQVLDMLGFLSALKSDAEPVYVSGGKLYRRSAEGKLVSSDNPAAAPYAWPLGHDVRPAKQALGARGCSDCHTTDAPIYFAKLTPPAPAQLAGLQTKSVYELRGDSGFLATMFDLSFTFRPLLKIIGFATAALILAVLVVYGLRGLSAALKLGRDE